MFFEETLGTLKKVNFCDFEWVAFLLKKKRHPAGTDRQIFCSNPLEFQSAGCAQTLLLVSEEVELQ